jgi:hypothetical protein
MQKENLNTDFEQIITYERQGVSGTTPALQNMAELPMSNQLTLDDKQHAVVDFLQRPIDVAKISWASTSSASAELIPGGISFPDVFLKNPMYAEKLRGFLGLRGTMKVKVMLNAQKFQSGLLMGYWIPNASNLPVKVDMVQASLSGKSGCPNIQMNCEGGTEQTLEIPYVNQHVYYNMATNDGNYGKFFLTPILPLDQGTVGIRIQAWIEFPQPQFATSAVPVLSQSSSQTEEENLHDNTILASSGPDAALNTLSTALSDFSLKPSYFAQTASNVLQLMGYSKPTNQASICRTSLRANSYMANYNGEFMGHKLSLAADNILADMPNMAGSDSDEMALSYVSQIPTYYRSFTINTTTAQPPFNENYVVFADSVHPSKFVSTSPGTLDSTFLGYVSSAFAQWRGGIKYTVKLAKTGFHSGTLRATFLPGVYDFPIGVPNPITKPEAQLERVYQKTFDLRDLNEFTVTIPYAATRPYLNVVNPNSNYFTQSQQKDSQLGVFIIDIFVPVVAPPTVTQNVKAAVFVSGAEDIAFANPTAPNIYPYSTVVSQSFSLQEPTDRVVAPDRGETNINSSSPKMSLLPSGLCTGEVVSSIKALLSRFGPYYFATGENVSNIYQLAPFDFQDPIVASGDSVTFDYLDYFSYLYAFYRGGLRFSYDPGTSDPSVVNSYRIILRSCVSNLYPDTASRVSTLSTSNISSQIFRSPFANAISRPNIEGLIDFEVPYYNTTHITPALTSNHSRTKVAASSYPSPLITIVPRNGNTSSVTVSPLILRSAADDFRFFYLIGPPRVALLDTDTTINPEFQIPAEFRAVGVTWDGVNNFQGLFVNNFNLSSPALYDPPTTFSAVSTDGLTLYFLPRNLRYTFTNATGTVKMSAPTLTIPNAQMQTIAPVAQFATTNLAPDLYTSPADLTTTPATSPDTAVKFVKETSTIAANKSTIRIPSQSTNNITFGTGFTLTKPMVFVNQDLNRYLLLKTGTTVVFTLTVSGAISFIFIIYSGQPWYIMTSIPAQTPFVANTLTNTFSTSVNL